MKHIFTLHVTRCPVVWAKRSGSVVSSVAGQFLWLNVYRVTQGHNSCQFVPPLGTRRNRGNLFSLARLSSHTETVFVLFDCIAPLGSLTLLPPSLHFNIPSFFSSTFLSCLHVSLFPLGLFFPSSSPSVRPSLPPSTVTQGYKGEVLLCCVFACLVAGFVVSKWGH